MSNVPPRRRHRKAPRVRSLPESLSPTPLPCFLNFDNRSSGEPSWGAATLTETTSSPRQARTGNSRIALAGDLPERHGSRILFCHSEPNSIGLDNFGRSPTMNGRPPSRHVPTIPPQLFVQRRASASAIQTSDSRRKVSTADPLLPATVRISPVLLSPVLVVPSLLTDQTTTSRIGGRNSPPTRTGTRFQRGPPREKIECASFRCEPVAGTGESGDVSIAPANEVERLFFHAALPQDPSCRGT